MPEAVARSGGPEVLLVPDGAVSGNPGPGGWAALLFFGAHKKTLSGGHPNTTNKPDGAAGCAQRLGGA